ncbi:type II toxin-antitoxin system antitoxin MazE [Caminibacter profundus]
MNVKVSRWGNSYGIRLSKNIINKLSLKENDELNLTIIDNKLILTPKITLDDMLDNINENNLHSSIDFENKGKELL